YFTFITVEKLCKSLESDNSTGDNVVIKGGDDSKERKLLLRCGVQISPSAEDLGETLCSLNFASHVKGIEYGPACKQADFSELLKYKYLAKKSKHDEKEAKKLQENVQSLQLRLSAREHICRNLQEKVLLLISL
ncbi:hypothetical protein SOVF_115140, partial [Spinacia oleracea]